MKSSYSRNDDDLGVLISLAIAIGMLIVAILAVCTWNVMSDTTEATTSMGANEIP